MHTLILKRGREKSLLRRHPWIFSGAVDQVQGNPACGETVEIRSAAGEFLAVAAYSPASRISARVWNWEQRVIDTAFIHERVLCAASRRRTLLDAAVTDAARLIHGENDGLPGIVADCYGDTVVVQLLSAGAEHWRDAVADALFALPGVTRVWERSDADVRGLEGLVARCGLLRGPAVAAPLTIREHGLKFQVAVETGHKTGFYLDQRDNRLRLQRLAAGQNVLDCFCYSGGFALNAVAGGAVSVTAIDSSADAISMAQRNVQLNSLAQPEWIEADVFRQQRMFRDQGRTFDLVVLDPPKFAPTAAHAEKAARAYKDINLMAFRLLAPGGALMTYSCSGGINADLFQKIVAGAALDAGVEAYIEGWLHAASDHPVALHFPEGQYLKGLICRLK